ncbi:hypothetical protein JOC75_000827 [Metabacillus crassostreae]|nr:hypothetical protein [Metabacillus crassostreae]
MKFSGGYSVSITTNFLQGMQAQLQFITMKQNRMN